MHWGAWPEVAAGAGAVVAVFVALVGLLLLFQRRFAAHGPVRIEIEGGTVFEAVAGESLLSALREHGVLLPSGCAGAGTCGLCRVRLLAGGGEALPPERVHLDGRELRAGWRLACQVRMRDDLRVELPLRARSARQLTCTVQSARDVATFIREIRLVVPPGERFEFEAGSFVQVEVPAFRRLRFADFALDARVRPTWERYALLELVASNDEPTTRAYSLANPPAEAEVLVLNVRIATPPPGRRGVPPGVGSSFLYGLRAGDSVQVSGPFGEFHICDGDREMVYIGGGAGMAPLRSHILHLFRELGTTRRVSYWYGARSRQELFYTEELEQLAREQPSFTFHIALSEPLPEDDWAGDVGFIHEVVRARYLADHGALDDVEFYLCGPPAMLGASLQMLDELGVDPDRIAYDDFGG